MKIGVVLLVHNVIVHMNYIIEGEGALVNEVGEETPLKAGDFEILKSDILLQNLILKSKYSTIPCRKIMNYFNERI